jgi:hypothetical protein
MLLPMLLLLALVLLDISVFIQALQPPMMLLSKALVGLLGLT